MLFVKNSFRTCTFSNKCNIFYDKPTLNNNFNVNDGLNIYMYFIDLSLRCKFYGCPKLLVMTLYLHLSHTNVRYFSGRQKQKILCHVLYWHFIVCLTYNAEIYSYTAKTYSLYCTLEIKWMEVDIFIITKEFSGWVIFNG